MTQECTCLLGTTAPCDEGTWTPSCPAACTECVVAPAASEGRDTWCLWCGRILALSYDESRCPIQHWLERTQVSCTLELHSRVYCCNSQHDRISGHERVSLRRQWTTAYGVWHAVVVAGRSSFQPVSSRSLQNSTDCQSKRQDRWLYQTNECWHSATNQTPYTILVRNIIMIVGRPAWCPQEIWHKTVINLPTSPVHCDRTTLRSAVLLCLVQDAKLRTATKTMSRQICMLLITG